MGKISRLLCVLKYTIGLETGKLFNMDGDGTGNETANGLSVGYGTGETGGREGVNGGTGRGRHGADGKKAKSLEEVGKMDTPLSNLRSVSAGGLVAYFGVESRHYGYLIKILNFAIMKIKFNEISPSMQGLKVEGGRLVNRMADGQANVGRMGITVAAEMRKELKQAKKQMMMTNAYVAAERLTERLEGPEGM